VITEFRRQAKRNKKNPAREHMIYENIRRKARAYFELWNQRRSKLRTKGDFTGWQRRVRRTFLKSLGPLPKKTPLNPRACGKLECEKHIVEKVIFESRPKFFVTANLYLPKNSVLPAPGVLFACGHTREGKAYPLYQLCCIDLAQAGFAVLAFDPVCQGERLSFRQSEVNFDLNNPCLEHTPFGNKLTLLGYNLANIMLWDGIRALDYLVGRPEVDEKKIACVGNSGGGTHTAYQMAVDKRIKAACPCCYITTRENLLDLGAVVADAEQFQHGSISEGIDHCDFLASFAPKPLCVHAARKDYFPIGGARLAVERARPFYEALGGPENIEIFETNLEHGLSRPFREHIVRFFAYHLQGRKAAFRESAKAEIPENLKCLRSGNVRQLKGVSLSEIIRRKAGVIKKKRKKRPGELRRQIKGLFKKELSWPFLKWKYLQTFGDYRYDIRRYRIYSEEDVGIMARLYLPKIQKGKKHNALFVFIGPDANARGLKAGSIQRKLADAGCVCLTADLRGWGQARGDIDMASMSQYLTEDCYYEFNYLMLGESYLGNRLKDLMAVMKFIEKRRRELELPGKIVIIGEAAGAWVASFAAILHTNVKGLVLVDFLSSLEMLFESDEYRIPSDLFAFGGYSVFDLPDLLKRSGRKKIVIRSAVDGMARPLSMRKLKKILNNRRLIFRSAPLSAGFLKSAFK